MGERGYESEQKTAISYIHHPRSSPPPPEPSSSAGMRAVGVGVCGPLEPPGLVSSPAATAAVALGGDTASEGGAAFEACAGSGFPSEVEKSCTPYTMAIS
jgi:hypothetical protein